MATSPDAGLASDMGAPADGAVPADLGGGPDQAGPINVNQGGCAFPAGGSGGLTGSLVLGLLLLGLVMLVSRRRRSLAE